MSSTLTSADSMALERLRRLDIALLLAFEALMLERNVTRAARRLGVAQPTLSGELARMRSIFGDVLFIRTAAGMNPSPIASTLYPSIREVLDILRTTVTPAGQFNPASGYEFSIGMSEYASCIILPKLIGRIRKRYPNLVLHVETLALRRSEKLLYDGDLDLAVGVQASGIGNLRQTFLLSDNFSVVMSSARKGAKGRLDIESYARAPHVLVSPDGLRTNWRGVVDEKLADLRESRTVHLTLQHFFLAAMAAHESDLVMTVPTRIARMLAPPLGLLVRKAPIRLDEFTISLVWHQRAERHAAISWLRDEIRSVAKDL